MSVRLSSVHCYGNRARQHARARRNRQLWALEGLEGRVLLSGSPTYYTVNLTSDTGAGLGHRRLPRDGHALGRPALGHHPGQRQHQPRRQRDRV